MESFMLSPKSPNQDWTKWQFRPLPEKESKPVNQESLDQHAWGNLPGQTPAIPQKKMTL